MSEAEYMDDCQQCNRYDEESGPEATHEVKIDKHIVFRGSRAACWEFKRHNGGWVQETSND